MKLAGRAPGNVLYFYLARFVLREFHSFNDLSNPVGSLIKGLLVGMAQINRERDFICY